MNGREEGGQYYISQTCDQERFEARKVVFRGSVSTFLELVVATACTVAAYPSVFVIKPLFEGLKINLSRVY